MQQIYRTILALSLLLNGPFLFSQINKGLIASYYFSGNAHDSISNIHGIVKGASLSSDRFGNANAAFCFDGQNDYINLGTNSDLRQNTMSISLWVKINDYKFNHLNYPGMSFVYTRARHDVQYYEAYAVGLYSQNNKFTAATASRLQQQSASMSRVVAEIDKWYHVVYMFDSDTTYLYVNAALQQKNYKGFISNYQVGDSVILGYAGNAMPEDFKYRNFTWLNGCLDDLKFYSRILNGDEINQLYNEANPKFVGRSEASKISFSLLLKEFWYVPVFLVALLLIIILVIRWRIRYIRKKENERNSVQQKFAQMEMMALRSQMNPHFIFNAINSIQHYVLTNEKELANKYLVKFSQLMRNILDLSKQELISLKDELDTVVLYLDIESLRFNNAFNFTLNVSEDVSVADIRLPPLLIQPFVENAIWHGLLLKEGPKELEIKVYRENGTLIILISDNGIGREAAQKFSNRELKRRSFGMEITHDRLSVFEKVFGIPISFEVHDKKDGQGASLGTMVIIKIRLENRPHDNRNFGG